MLSAEAQAAAARWDCHVHVFDDAAPVAPGHYVPQHRPLAAIEALAQSEGFGHLVLVQPSVYGTDNTVLLNALKARPGRHRGVVVIDASVSDAELAAMHALGVRGVRFNLVSPVGSSLAEGTGAIFKQLAPRLRAMGWHVQWYPRPGDLPMIAALHAQPRGGRGARRTGPSGGHAREPAARRCCMACTCRAGAGRRLGQAVWLVPAAGGDAFCTHWTAPSAGWPRCLARAWSGVPTGRTPRLLRIHCRLMPACGSR